MDNRKPYLFDAIDKELVSILKSDARAPVAKLAKILGVSRGTVQNRLERLVSSGAILGFTIRAHEQIETDAIKAVMMIEVVGKSTTQVIQKLRGIPQLLKMHTTNGAWDLIAEIQTSNLQEFDLVLREVRAIDGVLNSETSILLSSV
ncbi:Lrp/AsnC family transcriptional regulator [Pseudoalteromonas sp. MTN2-4]|uniref:Lrp/AsnC family transcriptional regulator n=1 Tax=Pseudoalteromonas sp. MTN2-4 TaxID=3056555 RepID=UPI0036F38225